MPTMRPLDPAFPIGKQLSIETGPVVLVNIFTLDPDDEATFLKIWREDALYIKQIPGFVSSQLHRAIGTSPTYFNYAIWESTAAYRAVLAYFSSKVSDYPSSVVTTPHLFQKVAAEGICIA